MPRERCNAFGAELPRVGKLTSIRNSKRGSHSILLACRYLRRLRRHSPASDDLTDLPNNLGRTRIAQAEEARNLSCEVQVLRIVRVRDVELQSVTKGIGVQIISWRQ